MKSLTKKIVLSLLVLSIILLGAGCSSNTDSDTSTETPQEKTVKLRFSSNVTSSEIEKNKTAMAQGLNAWINTVEKESNGAIQVDLFTDSQLASKADQIVNGIQTGGFEVAHFATGNWAEYTDAFAELNVPYLYSNYDSVHAVMESEIGKAMLDKLEADVPSVKALAYIDIGFRHITNSKGTIKSPDDIKGLKIRTMNDKLQIDAMEKLGASVTPLSFSELYSALQQGLVDAEENPLSTIYSNKFYEVQDYCTLTKHTYTSTFVFMNKDVYEGLSDEQKAAVEAANKACTEASLAAAPAVESEYAELLGDAGMEIYEPTEEELKAFREKASKSWSAAEEIMGSERYNALLKVVEEAEK